MESGAQCLGMYKRPKIKRNGDGSHQVEKDFTPRNPWNWLIGIAVVVILVRLALLLL